MELITRVAIHHQTLKCAKSRTCCFGFSILVVNIAIFFVHCKGRFHVFLELVVVDSGVFCDEDFIELSFADGALVVFHYESESQDASMANVFVIALTQSKEFQMVKA